MQWPNFGEFWPTWHDGCFFLKAKKRLEVSPDGKMMAWHAHAISSSLRSDLWGPHRSGVVREDALWIFRSPAIFSTIQGTNSMGVEKQRETTRKSIILRFQRPDVQNVWSYLAMFWNLNKWKVAFPERFWVVSRSRGRHFWSIRTKPRYPL